MSILRREGGLVRWTEDVIPTQDGEQGHVKQATGRHGISPRFSSVVAFRKSRNKYDKYKASFSAGCIMTSAAGPSAGGH